ncbi:unnamed protein product [Clonostachys rosea f. rosea IK726]|uniref:Uncharacterized protein n=1 Tax=Clonostachys rosea f. rosea IK726 TaxID=1349383 RepID=A0ACA9UCP3_BIOOC|nr:unnamed protein product [Clonostachys rosea f. rosea IK726]
MSRFGGWLRSSVKNDPEVENAAAAAAEKKNLEDLADAMKHAQLIMNDDLDGAYAALKQGDSVFHSLGSTVTFFLRSVLGMEKQVMTDTLDMLYDCETKCANEIRTAQKRGRREGSIYEPGAEYELVKSQTLLMGAVVGVLQESLMEAMKSFLKLRKAYVALDTIIAAENKALGLDQQATLAVPPPGPDHMPGQFDDDMAEFEGGPAKKESDDSSSDEFLDAKEAPSGLQTPAASTALTTPEPSTLGINADSKPGELSTKDIEAMSSLSLEDPMDVFVHSGANMGFGTLMLLLTLVPPSLGRVLSVVGFQGDRVRGVQMLWESTVYDNIFGAVSAMVLLGFYNGILGTVDILPTKRTLTRPPRPLAPLRKSAKSCSRPCGSDTLSQDSGVSRRPVCTPTNVSCTRLSRCFSSGPTSKMKQVTALNDFELSIDALLAQDWNLMRDSFLRCLENNEWSPAMYYFAAGCASLELYRDAHHGGDTHEARRQKAKAEAFIRKAPSLTGAKKFMARKLPFEAFLLMKIKRWEERAAALKVDLADAVGTSPAMELCYMWNGTRRMGGKELENCIPCLSWERCTSDKVVETIRTEQDELACWALTQGKFDEARSLLDENIMPMIRKSVFKGPTKNDYVLPAATYELGAIAWEESCADPPAGESDVASYRRRKAEECEAQLTKVTAWEAFSLDFRIGLRVQSGMETLKWFKTKNGWA